jgi:hypothetical protein
MENQMVTIVVFAGPRRAVLINYPSPDELRGVAPVTTAVRLRNRGQRRR